MNVFALFVVVALAVGGLRLLPKRRRPVAVAIVALLGLLIATAPAPASFTTNNGSHPTVTVPLTIAAYSIATPTLSCQWTAGSTTTFNWTGSSSWAATQLVRQDNGGGYSNSGSAVGAGTNTTTDASASTPSSHTYDYKVQQTTGSAWTGGYSNVVSSTASAPTLVGAPSSYCKDGIAQLAPGAVSSKLNNPVDVAVDGSGNVYIADTTDNAIRKITATTGVISTIAGGNGSGSTGDNGAATSAKLASPRGLAIDSAGDIFVADTGNHAIRMIAATITDKYGIATKFSIAHPVVGNIYTVAGIIGSSGNGTYNGTQLANAQKLNTPRDVAVDSSANLYITDQSNNRLVKVNSSDTGLPFAGTGVAGLSNNSGSATAAQVQNPEGIAVDSNGNVYFADKTNNEVRCIPTAASPSAGYCMQSSAPTQNWIYDAAGDAAGASGNGGDAAAQTGKLSSPWGVDVDASGNLLIGDSANALVKVEFASSPGSAYYGASGHTSYKQYIVAGVLNGSSYTGDGYPLTGTGAANAGLPYGVAFSGTGFYFVDNGKNLLRWADAPDNLLFTWAGQTTAGSCAAGVCTGDGSAAHGWELNTAAHSAVDSSGNLYFADSADNRVREWIASSGYVKTIAGTGSSSENGDSASALAAGVNGPNGVAVTSSGDVYIADQAGAKVRKIDHSTGNISTVIGSGSTCTTTCGTTAASSGNTAGATKFDLLSDVAVDGNGDIFVSDYGNCTIRMSPGANGTYFNISMTTGTLYTIAGQYETTCSSSGDSAAGTSAHVNKPDGIEVDANGNLFIAERGGAEVRCLAITATANYCGQSSPSAGYIYSIAGNGTATDGGNGVTAASSAVVGHAWDVSWDATTSSLYVTDASYSKVRCVAMSTTTACGTSATAGKIYTVAGGGLNGVGGWAQDTLLTAPVFIAVKGGGCLFIGSSTANADLRIVNGPDP